MFSVADSKPVANAGPDRTIRLPTNTVTLNGSASTDDVGITSYSWKKVAPDNVSVVMDGANTPILRISNLVENTYVFSLTVTDRKGQTDTKNVSVVVLSCKYFLNKAVKLLSPCLVSKPISSIKFVCA